MSKITSKINIYLLVFIVILLIIITFLITKKADAPVVNNSNDNKTNVDKAEILGNKEDLVSFSLLPGQEVSGIMKVTGMLKGGYFFEGNFGLEVLDMNKKSFDINYVVTKQATSDWMTSGPVSFTGTIDFTNLPKGKAYIAITADDPRDQSERGVIPIKQILIPVVIN